MEWLSWEKMVTLWMVVVSIGFLLRTLALYRIESKLDRLLKDKEKDDGDV